MGDTVSYTITVFNNISSPDTPAKWSSTIVDALLGINEQNVVIANGGGRDDPGRQLVIPPNAPDPFVNTVNVHATRSPEGFPNVLDDSASFSTPTCSSRRST